MENNDVLYWEEARKKLLDFLIAAELIAIRAKPEETGKYHNYGSTDWYNEGIFELADTLKRILGGEDEAE